MRNILKYAIAVAICGGCLYTVFVLINFEAMIALGIGAIIASLAEIETKIK